MTGQSLAIEEQFAGKWLQLLKEAAPQLSRIAYLWNPANHSSASSWKVMQGLAPTCAVTRRRFSSGCKAHPAIRSSRKQPGQAWR